MIATPSWYSKDWLASSGVDVEGIDLAFTAINQSGHPEVPTVQFSLLFVLIWVFVHVRCTCVVPAVTSALLPLTTVHHHHHQRSFLASLFRQLRELVVRCMSDLLEHMAVSPFVEPDAIRPLLSLFLLYDKALR
jgi:hypothetical protein